MKRNKRIIPGTVFVFIILGLFTLLIVMPLAWLVVTGFKTNRELFISPWNMPAEWRFSNYVTAWKSGIGRYFLNSVMVTATATLLCTTFSSMAAYALSRINFKSRNFWLMFIVAGLMLAPQSSLISLFEMSRVIGIYNNRFGLALVNSVFMIPFSTFLIRSYFLTISHEIEESAYLDGCGSLRIFYQLILPIGKPIIGSSIIVCSRAVWNDLMFALVLLETDKLKTIPVGLVNMKSFTRTNWTVLIAGLIIASLPLVILFLAMQRHFVRGLSAGSVKG